jgi:hypothetical protein
MILSLLVALVAMAAGGVPAAVALQQIKEQAGDYWPHLEKLLTGADGLKRAAGMALGVDLYRTWFEALIAEISCNGKKTNGRTTARKSASGTAASRKRKSAAGAAGTNTGRRRRSAGND